MKSRLTLLLFYLPVSLLASDVVAGADTLSLLPTLRSATAERFLKPASRTK